MANTWTDELRAEAVEMYLERIGEFEEADRATNSTEVCKGIADELDFSVNSVRAILQRATDDEGNPVYIKATKAPKAPKAKAASTGGKKMSKADAQAELVSALQDGGAEVSDELMEVIEKLTGKAAQALAGAIRTMGDDE
ncbi:D3 protein [Vibrio phage AG74]|uniref:D3 protein n=1 Tax=Vibrio phage AG74 TaxID=2736261 RepID=A0A6M9Z0G6_9CAUD|nr:DNA binding protein [Vibrio phage AG74]QKN84922.1 D3 protein [Vibrio phage AG74]